VRFIPSLTAAVVIQCLGAAIRRLCLSRPRPPCNPQPENQVHSPLLVKKRRGLTCFWIADDVTGQLTCVWVVANPESGHRIDRSRLVA
jgi:hypothetical protein